MTGRLRVLLTIDVDGPRQDEFVALWTRHAAVVAEFADNHGQSLARSHDDPGRFVITSDWTDESTFRIFEQSDQQQRYLQLLWPMRRAGSMTLLTVVAQNLDATSVPV